MESYIFLEHFRVSKSIIPKHHNSGTFVFVMKKKATIAISISHWKAGWEKFKLSKLFVNIKRKKLRYILMILLASFYLCFYIFLTCINSIPTFNFWLKKKNSNHGIKILLILVLYIIILYAYTIKLASTFTYFALILCYFFIGLLVNPGTSGIIAAAAIIVIGYIISTITDYYHGYVVFLQKIVSVFKELIDDSIVQVSGDKLPPFNQDDRNNDYGSLPNDDPQDCQNDNNEIAGTSTDISLQNIDEIPQPAGNQIASTSAAASLQPTGNQLAGTSAEASSQPAGETSISTPYEIRQDTEGLICVEKTLFNSIVQKYRPTEIQIMTIIIKIIIICLLLWVAISTLLFLEDFSKLNKQVKLLAAIFIAGIIHLFRKTMWNKAEKESKEKVLLKCIRSYIVEDYLDATLKSVGSNLNSPEGNELEQTTTV